MLPTAIKGTDMTKLKALALALGAALGIAAFPSAQAHDLRHTGFSNGTQRPGMHARHHQHRHFHHRHARVHQHH